MTTASDLEIVKMVLAKAITEYGGSGFDPCMHSMSEAMKNIDLAIEEVA